MAFTRDQVAAELRRIQASIPKLLLQQATGEQEFTPTIRMVVDKALEDPNISEEKKQALQVLKDSGDFTRKKVKENTKITKQIDQFVEREIKKSIKAGKLPPRSKIKDIIDNK